MNSTLRTAGPDESSSAPDPRSTPGSLPPGAIRLTGVAKKYGSAVWRPGSLKEAAFGMLSGTPPPPGPAALEGINLDIKPGEAIGIIGHNGSGKSTILKLIAGITEATSGSVEVGGRVHCLIELGAGFHGDLNGEENAHLQGAIYGLTAAEMNSMIDSIFDYAGLDSFRTTQLKFYSTGMKMRLGFAIAIHCEPDILLVDEVLSVGDMQFQRRCLASIEQLHAAGVTIIFVTHEFEFAERICERLVCLKAGRIQHIGPSREVTHRYLVDLIESEFSESEGILDDDRHLVDRPGRFGTGEALIKEIRLVDEHGEMRRGFAQGSPFAIEIEYRCIQEIPGLDCSVMIDFEDGTNFAYNRAGTEDATALQYPKPGEAGCFRLWFDHPPLGTGRFRLTITICPPDSERCEYDMHYRIHHFMIEGGVGTPGATGTGDSPGASGPAGAPLRLPMRARWV